MAFFTKTAKKCKLKLFLKLYETLFVFIYPYFCLTSRQRPYHVEYTGSRPITEVKQRWARLVLGWVTAWEHRVLLASLFSLFIPFFGFFCFCL